ncbi:MAG: tetratricopeptide repeat protein [Proteobacteria bacterium]|nr:tetratricopeptide repeat protein [Pseudomonadota bacterium]
MRWAILSASVAALGLAAGSAMIPALAASAPAAASPAAPVERDPAALLRTTSPPNPAPNRTYADPSAALMAADVDYLVREARREVAQGDHTPLWTTLVFTDDFASDRLAEARTDLENAPGGVRGGLGDMFEPFLLAAEGRVDQAVQRVDSGGDNLPAPLPAVEKGLVLEGAGRLQEAAANYATMISHLDLTPPPTSEPANMEELQRALGATRVTHAVYRAALVNHRLGRAAEARRLYGIVAQFAPRSADVEENLRRLDAGRQPLEAPLDLKSAAGRWMIFLSEYLTQSENLQQTLSQQDPAAGLTSSSGAALLQLGVLLAPDANDWRLFAAQELQDAGGLDGAERIINLMPATSVFAPDADIIRASIQVRRHNNAAANASADRAAAAAGSRWSIVAAAADIYRRTGRSNEAIASYTRALGMAQASNDRADILGYRAFAYRFAGNYAAATEDMRAAYALDQSVDTRLLYVSILMDDPQAWADGIQVARGLFAEQPDSVIRLNTLGYALIQHPEGLEEGYRLLWRGFNNGRTDYAVVDSLAWAYYLYGHFDEAKVLAERANALSVRDPNAELLDHLGDIYWRLHRQNDARDAWRRALDAQPDVPRTQSLQQKIAHGLTTPAPQTRPLPRVTLPEGPAQRQDL